MWPKLITHTTEAIPVVSVPTNRFRIFSTSGSEKEFDLIAGVLEKGGDNVFNIFEMRFFLLFLVVAHQNQCHFLKPEAKPDKICMLQIERFCVWRFNFIWPDPDLTLTASWVRRKNECFHRILRPKWPLKRHPHNIFMCLNRWDFT